ncbi:MAG: bifunctional 3-deoxy-7-phosphoheptulonate synthase/chorismate mutase [Gemmatimonadaceae bacterium]|nr:bifunctional 3-deoxy-7-phosphoheptulonate synthase/chorismate mutase [Gemmatimonadaceae bacterium]
MSQSIPALAELRERIGALDTQLLELLAQRQECARAVAESKLDAALPLRDTERERVLLGQHAQQGQALGLNPRFVTRVFQTLIEESLRTQRHTLQPPPKATKVAVLGGEGSYSAAAARACFTDSDYQMVPGQKFSDVVRLLRRGEVDYAVLPIENSLTGAISAVYDLLRDGDLYIVGEHYLPIVHSLLARPGVTLGALRRVHGHPQSLAQCETFLQGHDLLLHYCDSTAEALRTVAASAEPDAVVAGADAGRAQGLVVLAEGIANAREVETRFIVLGRARAAVQESVAAKTSLLFSTWSRPGALVDALQVFRDRGINLTRIESRPMEGEPWQMMFFVDAEGNADSSRFAEALHDVARCTRLLRVLGCYPNDRVPPTDVPLATVAQSEVADVPAAAAPAVPSAKAPVANKAWKLASRAHKPDDTIIEIGRARIGGNGFMVMAGPCSVESEGQIEQCAEWSAQHGAAMLRGGCFKPRTSPYAFQGLGLPGLAMMKAAGQRHGLPIITEVMAPEQVDDIAAQSDALQIGARNMQNFSLLKAVGRTHLPVLLKRGLMSSVDELLQAAEYILAGGNQQVMLCERGIRTFETATRNTLDLSAVPVLRELTHLPIIVDPSHAVGRRDLVVPMALAAKAVGAHGIIVEFHPQPEQALSDGPQALYFEQFAQMMQKLRS